MQEIDPQGQLVWEWTGSDHIDPVTEPTTAPVAHRSTARRSTTCTTATRST